MVSLSAGRRLASIVVSISLVATFLSSCSRDSIALFDPDVVHSISIEVAQEDYDAMIDELGATGEKQWLDVTVTIDGVTYKHAGARLKGNSSLAGLSGDFLPGGALPGAELPDGAPPAGDNPMPPTGGVGPGDTAGPGLVGAVSADEPQGLPWLIRLDQFSYGQHHQGYADIVIRSNASPTSLNESVALDLLSEAGLASQNAAYVRLSVNGGVGALRLMIEHPSDDAWQERHFDGRVGALYKANSGGDWTYRGDDPDGYSASFDQQGGASAADLTPLIGFLDFINNSDDATFAAELPRRLDVDLFATYMAMMDVIGNFDDIDGPGNNAYLWWDVEDQKLTIVPWDMNLSFGGLAKAGPGGPPPGAPAPPTGKLPTDGPPLTGGFGGFMRSNPLVDRFHETPAFEELYQEQLATLTESLIIGGRVASVLAARVELLVAQASDLVDEATITQDADAITASLTSG